MVPISQVLIFISLIGILHAMSTIEVHVRILPFKGESAWWTGPTHITPKQRPDLTFPFSHVHNSSCTNEDLFRSLAPTVSQVFQSGSNVTIMAYGQTGSGKTYTMLGESERHNGLFHLAADVLIKDAFARNQEMSKYLRTCIKGTCTGGKLPDHMELKGKGSVAEVQTGVAYGLRCAYLEIYNEQIRDLLQNPPADVEVREGISKESIHFDKLSWHSFATIQELQNLVTMGEKARATAPTPLNVHSSRSHTILTIERVKLTFGECVFGIRAPPQVERVAGQLHLVDLAGSECARLAATAGTHLREGGFINKSLLSLGNVVDAIVEQRSHIPYRESKLTRILCNSLGLSKNSRTSIICCINPDPSNLEQSLAGLRFAQRASKVVVHPKVLGTQPPSCILQLLNLMKHARAEGKLMLGQMHAAGLHDSTMMTMCESRRHFNVITHMFIEEFNKILLELCRAIESAGGILVEHRNNCRLRSENIQHQKSYLNSLMRQTHGEQVALYNEHFAREWDTLLLNETLQRKRATLDAFEELNDLAKLQVDLARKNCHQKANNVNLLRHETSEDLKIQKAALEITQENLLQNEKKRFIAAGSQRAARKQCDRINMERADVEFQIHNLHEVVSRQSYKENQNQQRKNHLVAQQRKIASLKELIHKKTIELNALNDCEHDAPALSPSMKSV